MREEILFLRVCWAAGSEPAHSRKVLQNILFPPGEEDPHQVDPSRPTPTPAGQCMGHRWREAALLLGLFILASRDVDRTIRENSPVPPEQTKALNEYLQQRRKA